MLSALPLLLAGSALGSPALPSSTCSVDQACEVHNNNLIQSLPDIETVEECKQLCADNNECNFMSHFGPTSSPFHNFCMLLSKCPSLHDCEDCWSEDKVCFDTCDNNIEGQLFDNSLEILPDTKTEPACMLACKSNPECEFYSYYTERDPNYPNFCILQAELEDPLQPCQYCRTGIPDCRNVSRTCSFTVGGNETISAKFTESTTVSIPPIPVLLGNICELDIVLVGGGGLGNSDGGGGGGSGQVVSATLPLSFTSQLHVNIGAAQQESSVATSYGEELVKAASGKDARSSHGADGYSGGGGGGVNNEHWGSGGQNGEDGENLNAGKGSGFDLSSVKMTPFTLSPGAGGMKHKNYYSYGGGGGGVLVDGMGPQETEWDGEGYGGGMGGYRFDIDAPGIPGPGLVLMEIKSKQ